MLGTRCSIFDKLGMAVTHPPDMKVMCAPRPRGRRGSVGTLAAFLVVLPLVGLTAARVFAATFDTESVCVAPDPRAPSNNAATVRQDNRPLNGKLDPDCTGFIIDIVPPDNPNDRCILTAGHCFFQYNPDPEHYANVPRANPDAPDIVVEVPLANPPIPPIPLSLNTCRPTLVPAAQQFDIDWNRLEGVNSVSGNDWAVYRTIPHNPGQWNEETPWTTARAAFSFNQPAEGRAWKFGYGVVGVRTVAPVPPLVGEPANFCVCQENQTPVNPVNALSQTQTTATAAITLLGPDIPAREFHPDLVTHNIATCPADSGSPIVQYTGGGFSAVAIHTTGTTDATCEGGTVANRATSETNQGLQDAITKLCRNPAPYVPKPPSGCCALASSSCDQISPSDCVAQGGQFQANALCDFATGSCATPKTHNHTPHAPHSPHQHH